MQNEYLERHNNLKAGIVKECVDKIKTVIKDNYNGRMTIGDSVLTVKDDVVYYQPRYRNEVPIPMFGPEGWPESADIAHWADVVCDADTCYKAGNKEYVSFWNKK